MDPGRPSSRRSRGLKYVSVVRRSQVSGRRTLVTVVLLWLVCVVGWVHDCGIDLLVCLCRVFDVPRVVLLEERILGRGILDLYTYHIYLAGT